MFDYLICQGELPIPDELKDCKVNWSKEVFQTKSLEKLLFTYLVSKDGSLFRDSNPKRDMGFAFKLHEDNWGLDYPGKERANGLEDALALIDYKTNHHGYVIFYTIVHDVRHEYANKDCRLEFIAKFTDGKLQNIDVNKLDWYKAASEIKPILKKRGLIKNLIIKTGLFFSRISHEITKFGYWI